MKLFGEVEHALDITWDIAQRCHVKLEKVKDPFPRFDVPDGHSADTYFASVAREGFEKRRPHLEWLRQQGCEVVEGGTQVRNIPSARLFRRCGFVMVGASVSLRKLCSTKVLFLPKGTSEKLK